MGTRFAAVLALLTAACSGAPTTIVVSLAPDSGALADAADDALPQTDAATNDAAPDASPAEDASTSDASDAWVECFGTPVDAAALQPSEACVAAKTFGCPPCAPYGFDCADSVHAPAGMSLDGARAWSVDGRALLCAPAPSCVRDTSDDDACKAAFAPAFSTVHAYSCSTETDGGPAATRTGCQPLDVGGRHVECCL